MAAWIPITIAAAFLQNARSTLQKHLKGRLGGTGATYVRFLYGLPFALLFAALAAALAGGLPAPGSPSGWAVFAGGVALGGMAQIFATFALLASFDHASFAVGTAFSKTEPIQAALFGALLLGEIPSVGVLGAIVIGVAGVAIATLRPGPDGARGRGGPGGSWRAAAWGLGSAAMFGLSVVGYRAASLSLGDDPAWLRAVVALASATALQTAVMGVWMAARRRSELAAVLEAWRPGLLVGATGAAASACWFTAFTLEPAAHVRALGNIELIFTFAASLLIFRERPSPQEWIGVALVLTGVVALLLATA